MTDASEPILHVGQLNLPPWPEFEKAFRDIFDRQFYANHGPLEQQLDRELAEFFGVKHAIGVVNATAALMLLLRALDVKGRVVTPSHTFPATAQAVLWAGIQPLFCDVDPATQTLTAERVAEVLAPDVGAILGVHVWGRACDPEALAELARARGLRLVFDAAHAMGCTHKGRRIGGLGDAEVFSFHATKILNGVEGGCVTTNDDDLAQRLRLSRSFHVSADTSILRLNAKLSEAQAAMALLGLRHFDRFVDKNRSRYQLYRAGLANVPGLRFIDYPDGEKSNYQFVMLEVLPTLGHTRDDLLDRLRERGILARRYFHPGVHRTPPFCDNGVADLPVTDALSNSLVQLPTGQAIGEAEVKRVIMAIREIAGRP